MEQLENFFGANGIEDSSKKTAILLIVMGPSSYKLLRSLIVPAKPNEKSFKELVEVLQKHHNLQPSRRVCNGTVFTPGFVSQGNLCRHLCHNCDHLPNIATLERRWR